MNYTAYEVREYDNGTVEYYLNGKLHRGDGPAVVMFDGTEAYWLNGKLCREDGPAVVLPDGTEVYWLHDKPVSKEEHARRTDPCAGKVVTVDGKRYKLTPAE